MATLRIRDATADDHATYVRLFAEIGTDDRDPDLDTFVRTLVPTMVFAEKDGEPVGFAYYRMLDGGAHLGQLATAPTARRVGVGRALMAETIARAKAEGAATLQLNVKPHNTAAIALYASFGLAPVARSWAFRMTWADILRQPAPHAADARELRADEDAAFEARLALPAGILPMARKVPWRLFRAIGNDTVAGFDAQFPGAFPFAAPDAAHAFSMLHALQPFARASDDHVMVTAESPALRDAFLEAGGHLRFEMLRMRGPI